MREHEVKWLQVAFVILALCTDVGRRKMYSSLGKRLQYYYKNLANEFTKI